MGIAELFGMARTGAPAVRVPRDVRLRALVDEHHEFIGRSLRRLGVPERDVDDACQHVFLVASRRLDDIRQGAERSFLFSIALRAASEARRAQRRRPEDLLDDVEGAPGAAKGASPEQLAAEREERALLDEVLEAMPLEVRAVFVLFELEELTMVEISRVLELPQGTVASRLRRGRELFHEHARRVRARSEASRKGLR